jgi:putative transcriptional regulator
MTKKKKLSRLAEALLEMAAGQHRVGIMDDASYRAIISRHLGPQAPELLKLNQRQSLKA